MVQVNEQSESVRFYIGPNVNVAADAAIAAGAVLEAAPGATLVIAAGVCIGAGAVVQATGGKLVLEVGVNLGGGVLIVGQGIVGAHACIGSDTTLFNPQVEAGAVIPARSLVYLPEAQLNGTAAEAANNHASDPATSVESVHNGDTIESGSAMAASAASQELVQDSALARIVYGREQVEQLMKTLFPHRDSLNGQNGSS
ncbi:MAG: hypothetical protein ACFB0E_10730 [Leptolyngbyaceae cyanobacterium]